MSLCKGFEEEPFVHAGSGTFIVPMSEAGEVLFIIEPRRVDGQPVLSLPGGGLEDGEDWAVSANRELQEELGFRAEKMDFIATLNPMYRVADWTVHIFLGRNLIPSKLQGDESYDLPVEKIPLSQLENLIASGRLMDSTIISALYMVRHFLERES
jgi:8-oxo-dGTP pyrophosphatase MutT (NUDIX family)